MFSFEHNAVYCTLQNSPLHLMQLDYYKYTIYMLTILDLEYACYMFAEFVNAQFMLHEYNREEKLTNLQKTQFEKKFKQKNH